jgi:hypothetical protein
MFPVIKTLDFEIKYKQKKASVQMDVFRTQHKKKKKTIKIEKRKKDIKVILYNI